MAFYPIRPGRPKGARSLLATAANGWRGRQRLDRRRLVVQTNVRVDTERQANIAVPGKGLGHFRGRVSLLQTGDEMMPATVEVRKQPIGVAVTQEIRLLSLSALRVCRGFVDPPPASALQIQTHHLVRRPLFPAW